MMEPTFLSLRRGAFTKKHLLIFDDQVFFRKDKIFSGSEAHLLFMLGFLRNFGRISFFGRVHPVSSMGAYPISDSRVNLLEIPYYKDVKTLCFGFPRYLWAVLRTLNSQIKNLDFVWLNWPHPLSLAIILYLKILHSEIPWFIVVRQNQVEMINKRYRGLSRYFGLLLNKFLEIVFKGLTRDPLIFTVGEEMGKLYGKISKNTSVIMFPIISRDLLAEIHSVEKNRISAGAVNLLSVGRLEPEKGTRYLIQSLSLLKKRGYKVHLDLIGDGESMEELKKFALDRKVSEEICFVGYVPFGDKLYSYYQNADIFILPSLTEGIPKVFSECMVFGLPIISSDCGGVRTVLKDGWNALLVKPGSSEALAECIEKLISDKSLLTYLGENNKKKAETYNAETQQEILLSKLEDYINNISGGV